MDYMRNKRHIIIICLIIMITSYCNQSQSLTLFKINLSLFSLSFTHTKKTLYYLKTISKHVKETKIDQEVKQLSE